MVTITPKRGKKVGVRNNLISYFDTLIISFDKYGQIKDKSNKHISEKEIFKHIELKVLSFMEIKNNLSTY